MCGLVLRLAKLKKREQIKMHQTKIPLVSP